MKQRMYLVMVLLQLLFLASCKTEFLRPKPPENAHTFGEKGDELASGIVALPNNDGFLIVGSQRLPGRSDFDLLLIRTDAEGNEVWTKTYGNPDADELGWKVLRKPSGEYFIFGTKVYPERGETWVQATMLDADFNLIRQQNTISEFGSNIVTQRDSKLYHLVDGNTLVIYNENYYFGKIVFNPDGQVVSQTVLEERFFYRSGHLSTNIHGGGYALALKNWTYQSDSFTLYLLDQFGAYDRTEYILTNNQEYEPIAIHAFSNGTYHLFGYSRLANSNILIQLDANFQVILETPTEGLQPYNYLQESQSGKLFFAADEIGNGTSSSGYDNILFKTFDQTHQTIKESAFEGRYMDRILDMISLPDGRIAAIGQTNSYGAGGYDALFFFVEE